jgi:hypothetical protein
VEYLRQAQVPLSPPRSTPSPTQKRARPSQASERANTYYFNPTDPPATPPPSTPPPTSVSDHSENLLSDPSGLSSNYYSALSPDADDERSVTQLCSPIYNDTTQTDNPHTSEGSDTDLNPQDTMSTGSSDDSNYCQTSDCDDHFSADTADDISVIYEDQQRPPQLFPDSTLDSFDIMDFEAALSQQAFLHFQQLDQHVSLSLPQRHPARIHRPTYPGSPY